MKTKYTIAIALLALAPTLTLLGGGREAPATDPTLKEVPDPAALRQQVEIIVLGQLPETFNPHPFSRSLHIERADYHFTYRNTLPSFAPNPDDKWVAFSVGRTQAPRPVKAAKATSPTAPTVAPAPQLFTLGCYHSQSGTIRLLDPTTGQLAEVTPAPTSSLKLLGMK